MHIIIISDARAWQIFKKNKKPIKKRLIFVKVFDILIKRSGA